jgi:hypothetical protein
MKFWLAVTYLACCFIAAGLLFSWPILILLAIYVFAAFTVFLSVLGYFAIKKLDDVPPRSPDRSAGDQS